MSSENTPDKNNNAKSQNKDFRSENKPNPLKNVPQREVAGKKRVLRKLKGRSAYERERRKAKLALFFKDVFYYTLFILIIAGGYYFYNHYFGDAAHVKMKKEKSLFVRNKEIVDGNRFHLQGQTTHLGGVAKKVYPDKFVLVCEGKKSGNDYYIAVSNSYFYSTPRGIEVPAKELAPFEVFMTKDDFFVHYDAIEYDPNEEEESFLEKIRAFVEALTGGSK
ncbi:hypothetical protein [Rubellicoccus peritrichatus]|uniref:Uncharacterized protein n=1 Tax=Rubellicoccus peritrichatus TaxID=3080537 RepID=A0AAQ3QUE9_9BACT|nr:hypothetical protein [Puniceicoccus sp. CR14]WOO39632.1 hypothetical protein RZN69_13495 [Puniceicoccus sp. CR14]